MTFSQSVRIMGHQMNGNTDNRATTVTDLLFYLTPLIALTISVDVSDILLNAGLSVRTSTTPGTSNKTAATDDGRATEGESASMQVAALAAFGAAHRLVRWFWAGSWEMRSGK